MTIQATGVIREYSSDLKLLNEFALQKNIASPWHAIQVSEGSYAVAHGGASDPVHRVCLVDDSGKMFQSFGGTTGPLDEQTSSTVHVPGSAA